MWHSGDEENLYLSIVLRPPIEPMRVPPLTLTVGVALAETIAAQGLSPELKWPNDVLLDGRKCAGILCEMSGTATAVSHVIVGIGLDVNGLSLPEEIASIATSLRIARGGVPLDRAALLDALCASLDRWYRRFLDGGAKPIVEAWLSLSRVVGKTIDVTSGNERLRGVAEGLDEDGALLLRTELGTCVRVVAGEITA